MITARDRVARAGVTVIELLVVISVLGMLIGLLAPAVQRARESSRIAMCQNRLRQIGIASQIHVSAHRHFPTNGWGYRWVGVSGRGFGESQPGGWIYNLLPYLERRELRVAFTGTPAVPMPADKLRIELPIVRCPSRPGSPISANGSRPLPYNSTTPSMVAKTDFAVCEGDVITGTGMGPASLDRVQAASYSWVDVSKATGISFQRSKVQPRGVTDGLSNTYFAGEKHVSRLQYDGDGDPGYDQSALSGVDIDLSRWTHLNPGQDSDFIDRNRIFGSAHSSGFSMVYCDGSVKHLTYSIDIAVHRKSGNRRDGE